MINACFRFIAESGFSTYRLAQSLAACSWNVFSAGSKKTVDEPTGRAGYGAKRKNGSITIKALREAAHALDMQLVYGFVPKDGSLEALVERKAKELAKQIVLRTSNTMKLEDQENSQKRIEKAIAERTQAIKMEMPKNLWD